VVGKIKEKSQEISRTGCGGVTGNAVHAVNAKRGTKREMNTQNPIIEARGPNQQISTRPEIQARRNGHRRIGQRMNPPKSSYKNGGKKVRRSFI